jgi:hypothetical protein
MDELSVVNPRNGLAAASTAEVDAVGKINVGVPG